MSESSGSIRPDDPPTAYRDPLVPSTGGYTTGGAHAAPTGGTSTSGAVGTAKEKAARVGDEAKQTGAHVAGVAKAEASGLAHEAGRQAKGLLSQGRGQVQAQAAQQQQRAVSGLRGIGDQFAGLATGSPQPGFATDIARQAGERVGQVAQWLESRDPADLLSDLQRFARRRPGAFLAIAASAGLVAGRLTRGVAATAHDGSGSAVPGLSSGSGSAGSDQYAASGTQGASDATDLGSGYGSGYGTGSGYDTPGAGDASYSSTSEGSSYGSAETDPFRRVTP
jgi:hypothetical protein